MSYAIGVAEPLSITVMDYGTSSKSNEELTKIVRDNFDLRPGEKEKMLSLKNKSYFRYSPLCFNSSENLNCSLLYRKDD